jgi:hypothetical protein
VQDLDLAGDVGVVEPEVEAAALEGVVHLAGAVGGEHHQRRLLRPHLADLRDRHRVLGEHLQEEGLELVVGPVDLVDEQHRGRGLQRAQDRAGEQELGVVEGGLDGVDVQPVAPGRRLQRPQVQQLAREVPVVEGLGGVDAVVALEADQLGAEYLRERLGERGLAGAGLAFAEQRPAHAEGEVGRRGEPLVGEVAGGAEGFGQCGGRLGHVHGSSMTQRLPACHLRRWSQARCEQFANTSTLEIFHRRR